MPRKGAVTTTTSPEVTKQTEVVGEDLSGPGSEETIAETPVEEAKPARKPRQTQKVENNGTVPENGFEDWTRPAYADDPGEFEFVPLEDGDEHLSILWWGIEGTGKTTDLARVAASKLIDLGLIKGKVLVINAEGGAKVTPLRHHGIDTSIIMQYPKPGQPLTFEGLERLYYRLASDLEKDPNSWAAVGWDSITAIVEKLLDDVIEADMRKTAEILQRAKKGRDGRSGNITMRDRFETEGDDYASMSNQVRLLLRKYRTLPCHFLVTALERRDEDKKRKVNKITYGPAVNPALATPLLGYVDVAIRTQVLDDATYFGRTTPTEDSRGKDRMFSLPVEMVDPTFDRILAYVRGELKHETDPAQKRMPGGAEGILVRRSLADEVPDLSHHTQDGTKDGPPLAGDEDDPEPPKASGRRQSAASSGRTRATAPASAPPSSETSSGTSDEPSPDTTDGTEPPKRGGRRTARSSTSAAASKTPDENAEQPSGMEKASSARISGRKSTTDRAARAQVKAETEGTGDKPATRAAVQRAKEANKSQGGFNDEPPF